MVWIDVILELLPIIIPMIQECINADGREATFERLRSRPALVQWIVFRECRKKGYNIRDSRAVARETWELLEGSSNEDLELFLNQNN